MKAPNPTTLRGQWVSVVPLAQEQANEYLSIGQDAEIWKFLGSERFEVCRMRNVGLR